MQIWDENCPSRLNGYFECPFKHTLAGLFNPNPLVKPVRLNTLYCSFLSNFICYPTKDTFINVEKYILADQGDKIDPKPGQEETPWQETVNLFFRKRIF